MTSVINQDGRVWLERDPGAVEKTFAASASGDDPIRIQDHESFWDHIGHELGRFPPHGPIGVLARLSLAEWPHLRDRLRKADRVQIVHDTISLIDLDRRPLDLVGLDDTGRFFLFLPGASAEEAGRRLAALADRIVRHGFWVSDEPCHLTPVTSLVRLKTGASARELRDRLARAHDEAQSRLDLQPVSFDAKTHGLGGAAGPVGAEPSGGRLRLASQVLLVIAAPIALPFLLLIGLFSVGIDLSTPIYVALVAVFMLTAASIWAEGLLAVRDDPLPPDPGTSPPASAIIAAWLPNEAATIIETVEAFLKTDYAGSLQIILAYNTPHSLPVEERLRDIARRDPRFLPLRVMDSTSKAQNVNAALSHVRGDFVGVFDADHHPYPGSFARAWRWLASGADIVQGHCLVRNGDDGIVARVVAVEFESMYAVSHPGRARLHGFGVFGGSNGYWKTPVLRRIRMRGSMLTEDIDASVRAVQRGYRIVSDRHLISRELAPDTLPALWNQRMRWSQGWFQVSLRHFWSSVRSPILSVRQKLGVFHLLIWVPVYPWLASLVLPLIGFWFWRDGGIDSLPHVVPLSLIATLFTLSVGPGQIFFAYLLAAPEIQRRRGWFVLYFLVSSMVFAEAKNLIIKVAQVKELMGETRWRVTPRPVSRTGERADQEPNRLSALEAP